MSEVIIPKFEVKLNSEFEDLVRCNKLEENKLILMQFYGEEKIAYISLNETMVKINIDELKRIVDMFYDEYKNN